MKRPTGISGHWEADERFVLELFEDVVELAPDARAAHVERALAGRPDAARLTARLTRLLEIEAGLGDASGDAVGGAALLDELEASSGEASGSACLEAHRVPAGDALVPGRVVGDFTLLERIGRGGMGVVWRARQARPEREVALKLLDFGASQTRTGGAELARRFEREGHLLARFEHPGIATVHAMGVAETGQPWIAMEYVAGAFDLVTFAAGMDRAARLRLFEDVLAAVQHGHQKGIVHRDLKPDNLLVDGDGRVRVIDFGIAGLVADVERVSEAGRRRSEGEAHGPVDPLQTRAGGRYGTLAYMPPEALDGVSDVRGDVFALGLVLFELLTGRVARDFGRASGVGPSQGEVDRAGSPNLADGLARVREPVDLARAGLPPHLAAIVARATASSPEERYPTAEAFARDLVAYRGHLPIDAVLRAGAPLYELRCALRRHWKLVVAAGVPLVGLAVALAFALRATRNEAAQFARAEQAFERASALHDAALDASLDLVTDFAEKVTHLQGGLETRREMVVSGIAQLEALSQDTEELGPRTRLRMAEAYRALGQVLGYPRTENLGDMDGAEAAFDEARGILAELAAPEGDLAFAVDVLIERSNLDEHSAAMLRARGDWDAAIAAHATIVVQLEDFVRARGPEPFRSAEGAGQLARVRFTAARMQYAGLLIRGFQGEHEAARGQAREVIVRCHSLFADPAQLPFVDPGAMRAEDLPIEPSLDRLADLDDFDPNAVRFLIQQCWSTIGTASSRVGDPEVAWDAFARSRAVLEGLIAAEPTEHAFQSSYASGLGQEVEAALSMGDLDHALEILPAARAAMASQLEKNPRDVRMRVSVAFVELTAGRVFEGLAERAPASPESEALGADAELAFAHALEILEAVEAEGALHASARPLLEMLRAR